MNCPKCGRPLKDGNMLCEFCGEEIRIVPDFVPEIELSIEESINNMVMELNPEVDEVDMTPVNDNVDEQEDGLLSDSALFNKKVIIFYIIGLIILVVGIIVGAFIMISHDNSSSYQIAAGDKQLANGQVRKAIDYYNKAVDIEPSNIEYRIKLADCYMELDNFDRAIEVYKDMIIYDPTSSLAYAQIIALYESEGMYDAIDDFLHHNANDDIRGAFVDYLADEPQFIMDAGEYDEDISITLTNNSSGTIYYTVDGEVPSENSDVFKDPILLKKGKHTVKAIFKNEYGVWSSVASRIYDIKSSAPDEPILSLESGAYDKPQVIKVTAPFGCNVYYTLDGSDPDRSSRIYGEPIPLEQGISHYRFVSINSQNIASDIVEGNYKLEVHTEFTEEVGLVYLYQYLVNKGYIIDLTGASNAYPGNFSYLYSDLREIGEIPMYIYREYYVYGSEARAMTNNIFGVDVNTGDVYLLRRGLNDSFVIAAF